MIGYYVVIIGMTRVAYPVSCSPLSSRSWYWPPRGRLYRRPVGRPIRRTTGLGGIAGGLPD